MIIKSRISELAEEFLKGTIYFVVEINIRSGNRISVFIDGDQRVSVETCISLSRFIESGLDRESEDFDLTVSSCGADRPLKYPRQYLKNIDSLLDVVMPEGKAFTGKLLRAGELDFDIELIPSPGRKKSKEAEKPVLTFKYSEIKTAKELITFKK